MNSVLNDIQMVAFDVMGVIISNPSLVKEGLYPLYKDRYSYEYIKGLYDEVRSNVKGDEFLWDALNEENYENARKRFLDMYQLDEGFEEFRCFLKQKGIKMSILSNMPQDGF
jgi:2-hydroxy-3-keto-5-methylthiopentenyl-1-phosphate phosphatase